MLGWFLGTRIGRAIGFGVMFVALLAVAYWKIFTAGKASARAEQAAGAKKMKDKADAVEMRVDAAPPVELDRLRSKWTRRE